MTDVQRSRLMTIAASTLAACLLIIVGGFITIAVRAGDGDATKLITDNLWQLVWPLAIALMGIAGVSHFGPSTPPDPTPPSVAPSNPVDSAPSGSNP